MKIKTHWKAQTQLELCRQSVSPIANIREMRSLGFNFHWALFLLFSLLYSIVSTYRLRSFTFSSYLFCIYATFGHITLRRFKWGGGDQMAVFVHALLKKQFNTRLISKCQRNLLHVSLSFRPKMQRKTTQANDRNWIWSWPVKSNTFRVSSETNENCFYQTMWQWP